MSASLDDLFYPTDHKQIKESFLLFDLHLVSEWRFNEITHPIFIFYESFLTRVIPRKRFSNNFVISIV